MVRITPICGKIVSKTKSCFHQVAHIHSHSMRCFDASCCQNESKLLEGALGLPYRSINWARTIKEMAVSV